MKVWIEVRDGEAVFSKQIEMPALPPTGIMFFPDTGEDGVGAMIISHITYFESPGTFIVYCTVEESTAWELYGWQLDAATEFI